MELVPSLTAGIEQTGLFQDIQVLGDGLPGRAQTMFHRQPGAYLEQGLTVLVAQFVENRPPRGIGKSLEHVAHGPVIIGKCLLACRPALVSCIDLNPDPGYLAIHMSVWLTTGMTTTTERPCDPSV